MSDAGESVRCWRLVKARHARDAWNGEGAFRFGGRWNSRGVRVVYVSRNLSLALLEMLVHFDRNRALPDLKVFPADIPQSLIEPGPGNAKRGGSLAFSLSAARTREIGDAWAGSARSAALEVPSVVVPVERNIVLNPLHPDFPNIRIGRARPFAPDSRLG